MDNENKLIGYGYVSDIIEEKKETIFSMKIVANIVNKTNFGRTKLYKLLRDLGYIQENNYAVEKYLEEGYFINSETRRSLGDVSGNTNQILVTKKGLELIKKIVQENVK